MNGNCFNIYVTQPILPDIKKVEERMQNIWDKKWLTNMGDEHIELEGRLKKYLGVDNMTLFNNGTTALLLGIKALELQGEVITTPFTFPATLEAIEWCGLTPVFCDVERETGNIDASKIEELINEKTVGIVAVHVFGNPCDVEAINLIAKKYELKVIYDAAHAFGVDIKGKSIAEFGDMTMFSFHATKLFHTTEGGGLVVNNHKLLEKLYLLKNFGIADPDHVVLSGINGKMNEISAAIGNECIQIVPIELEKRKIVRQKYEDALNQIEGITFLNKEYVGKRSYQYTAIRIDKEKFGMSRNELHDLLKLNNIYSRKYFYPLLSNLEWTKDYPSSSYSNLKEANTLVNEVLVLPFYGDLTEEQLDMIITIIRKESEYGKS